MESEIIPLLVKVLEHIPNKEMSETRGRNRGRVLVKGLMRLLGAEGAPKPGSCFVPLLDSRGHLQSAVEDRQTSLKITGGNSLLSAATSRMVWGILEPVFSNVHSRNEKGNGHELEHLAF